MAEFTYEVPANGEPRATGEGKVATALQKLKEGLTGGLTNSNLSGAAGITRANLAAESKPVTWYESKIIATEQSRESTSFGTLTTADEITGVVVPAGGIVVVRYKANVKSSVSGAGRVALFIGANQLKSNEIGGGPLNQEAATTATTFHAFTSSIWGITGSSIESGADVTTGQSLAAGSNGGRCEIHGLPAATYAISVQYKATSGTITAKERKLWVTVEGY